MLATEAVEAIRAALSDDLRHPCYRGGHPTRGHCYVASEAVYHLLGGKPAGLKAMFVRHEGSPHWFLVDSNGIVLDPTADQFETIPPYHEAKGIGFLTKEPSKRCRKVLDRIGRQV